MYGKFFSSTFSGSMFGAGADVFAVWAYTIATAVNGQVELNPNLLAAAIGMEPERVQKAIEFLSSPDPKSRNPAEGGCRLVKQGQYQYRVVSHEIYRAIRNEDERRAYNAMKQREHREKVKQSNSASLTVNDSKHLSAHTEAEAEADTEEEKKKDQSSPSAPTIPDGVVEIISIWNQMAKGKLPNAKATPKRVKEIKVRLKEEGWVEDFKKACTYISGDPFFLGQNDNNWSASLDYLLRPGKATELAERGDAPKPGRLNGKRTEDADRAFLEQLKAVHIPTLEELNNAE